jgi:hypothetical protein
MSSNTEDISSRVSKGLAVEAEILAKLQRRSKSGAISVGPLQLYNWQASTMDEDKYAKIDAWVQDSNYRRLSVQIKYRESGQDLGLALVRPYEGWESFSNDLKCGTVEWDRDMQSTPNLYVVQSPGLGLVVVPGQAVKDAAMALLQEMAYEPFEGSSYQGAEGIEVRIVRDKGAGYTYDQKKLISYMTPRFLVKLGGKVLQDV